MDELKLTRFELVPNRGKDLFKEVQNCALD
jgi:hypothetical protein